MAADALDVRLARLEGVYEQLDRRLTSIESELRGLRAALDEGLRALGGRIDGQGSRIDSHVFWLAGILVTSLAGLAASLILLLLRP